MYLTLCNAKILLKGGDIIKSEINVQLISAFIAAFVTVYIARKNIFSPMKISVAKKQLYFVYLPLFKFIEPNLYKKTDIQVINDFLLMFENIKNNHYELIDSNLINDIDILKNSISSTSYNFDTYDSVCQIIDKNFEKNRRLLHLPRRTLLYRINKRQFPTNIKEFFNVLLNHIIEFMPVLILSLISACVFITVTTVYHSITSLLGK